MYKADQLIVEVHYLSLPAEDSEERRQRLRTLLLRGARRLAQQNGDCGHRVGNFEAAEPLHMDPVEK
jgi:hypothetical protein